MYLCTASCSSKQSGRHSPLGWPSNNRGQLLRATLSAVRFVCRDPNGAGLQLRVVSTSSLVGWSTGTHRQEKYYELGSPTTTTNPFVCRHHLQRRHVLSRRGRAQDHGPTRNEGGRTGRRTKIGRRRDYQAQASTNGSLMRDLNPCRGAHKNRPVLQCLEEWRDFGFSCLSCARTARL